MLDLKQKVFRKTENIQFSVKHKKRRTNINVDERSTHTNITPGFGDKARSLCDVNDINEELRNLDFFFFQNCYTADKIQKYLSGKQQKITVNSDYSLLERIL